MKHISKISQATTLVCALGAACLPSLSAHADTGTLTVKAAIATTTCALVIGDTRDSANGSKTSYKAMNLGNLSGTNSSSVVGATFGTPKNIYFTFKNPSNLSQPCAINSTFWQVKTTLSASQISSVANKTYLKNAVTGGTNAGVVITNAGGKEFDYSKISQIPLTLAAGAKSSPIGVIKAQFIHTTNTAATAGRYNFLLPLTVTYN